MTHRICLACFVLFLAGCRGDNSSDTAAKSESKSEATVAAAKPKTTTYEIKLWPEYATITLEADEGMNVLQGPGIVALSKPEILMEIDRGDPGMISHVKKAAIEEASGNADYELKMLTDTKDTLIFDVVQSDGSYQTHCYWLAARGDKMFYVSVATGIGEHRTTDQGALDAFELIKKSLKLKD